MHETQMSNAVNNPCIKEQKLSYKCLDDNNYNAQKCSVHFENYKKCKEFWHYIQSERRKAGIRPLLPPPEERQEIKQLYFDQAKA